MLRQHNKPEADKQDEVSDDASEKEIENKEEDDSDEEKNVVPRRKYHSDSDEDSNDETELKSSESSNVQEEKTSSSDKLHKRQTILLSATLTHAVEKLAGLTMHNPVFVDAAKDNIAAAGGSMSEINEDLVVPQSVTQSYIVTPPKLRMVTLSAYIAGKCQVNNLQSLIINKYLTSEMYLHKIITFDD